MMDPNIIKKNSRMRLDPRPSLAGVVLAMSATSLAYGQEPAKLADIVMSFGDIKVSVELMDTPPSRDLLGRLPVSIAMSRLAEREFAGRPQPGLTTAGSKQVGYTNGDLGYWTPGGFLAVFYRKAETADISDVVIMGHVTQNLSVFDRMPSSMTVRIERAPSDQAE